MTAPDWQQLLAKAREARGSGKVSQALFLYQSALAAKPPVGDPFFETGSFVAGLCESLAGLEWLVERHASLFGLTNQEFPTRIPGEIFGSSGWDFAATALLRALELHPTHVDWREELAAILERGGRFAEAIACRRVIAECVDSIENGCAIVRLLERQSASIATVREYEILLLRWSERPVLLLLLARAYRRAGAFGEAARFAAAIVIAASQSRHDHSRHAAFLLELSRAAAQAGAPDDGDPLLRDLLSWSAEAIRNDPESMTALLAFGYAAIAVGSSGAASRAFVSASALAEDDAEKADEDGAAFPRELRRALMEARAYLLDSRSPVPVPWTYPIDRRRLAVLHARERRLAGSPRYALGEYVAAVFEASGRHFSFQASAVYNNYRIFFYSGRYYAIPAEVGRATVLGGRVYRVPTLIYEYRRYIPGSLVARLRGATRNAGNARGITQLARFIARPAQLLLKTVARRFQVERVFTAGTASVLMAKIGHAMKRDQK